MSKDKQTTTEPELAGAATPPYEEDPMMSEQVTYRPGPEDPVRVQFGGHHLHANIPKQVRGRKSWFATVRNNPFFKVGDFDPKKDAVVTREELPLPKTSDQYKAFAVAWFRSAESLHDFDARWQLEEVLRQECGVGADDLDYLGSLMRPRRAELQKRLRP